MEKNQWLGVVKKRASLDLANDPPFQYCFREGAPTTELNKCVCTTSALHTFMFVTVGQCKRHSEAKYMQDAYAGLIQQSISTIREATEGHILVGQHSLQIDRGGQVAGFRHIIEHQHRCTCMMLLAEWGRQHEAGSLSSSIDRESLSLLDVVLG